LVLAESGEEARKLLEQNCIVKSEIVDFEMQVPKLNAGTAKDFLR
jgi:hypothetical protein